MRPDVQTALLEGSTEETVERHHGLRLALPSMIALTLRWVRNTVTTMNDWYPEGHSWYASSNVRLGSASSLGADVVKQLSVNIYLIGMVKAAELCFCHGSS